MSQNVTKPLPKKAYLVLAEEEWKNCFYNHKLSFKQERYSNKKTLLGYMCHLKSVSSKTPDLKWPVLKCIPAYLNISTKCLLCLYQKLEIVLSRPEENLEQKI